MISLARWPTDCKPVHRALSVCHWCVAATPLELRHNIILRDKFSGIYPDFSSIYHEYVENVS